MSSKIGERLEEARKRQGISIREASEATKVRSDFLMHFENNYFDFDLPEVYKEGFLKLYARFLKLSPEKMQNDYRNMRQNAPRFFASSPKSSSAQPPRQQQPARESFGRMDLPAPSKKVSQMVSDFDDFEDEDTYTTQPIQQKSPYLKVAATVAGGCAAVLALVFMLNFLMSSNKEEPSTAPTTVTAAAKPQPTPATPAAEKAPAGPAELKLFAEADVHVVVRQETDKQTLFYGTLAKGSEKTLSHTGPVKIRFNNGSHLTIQNAAGKRIKPGRSGTGWVEVS